MSFYFGPWLRFVYIFDLRLKPSVKYNKSKPRPKIESPMGPRRKIEINM